MIKIATSLFLIFFITLNEIDAQEVIRSSRVENSDTLRQTFTNQISKARIQNYLEVLAADSLEGRGLGTLGLIKARDYIVSHYQKVMDSTLKKENFFQEIIFDGYPIDNIFVQVAGDTYTDEYVIVSAHYDHVGKTGENIFNGADDNASGTAALMEMARVFDRASKMGIRPKRNIIFAHFTAEESGLIGSTYFVNNNKIPPEKIMVNLNIDMIGRVDYSHKKNSKYVYIIGADYISKELKNILEEVNDETNGLLLSNRYNSREHKEKFFKRTDSFPFSQKGIPFIFFTSGTHEDYHKPTDTADKIDYDALTYRARLIFAMAWELANKEEGLKIDQAKLNYYLKYYGN